MKNFIIIIPARLKSTRLPNKMMQLIDNKPVIEHTWIQASKVKAKQVIVATDDENIYQHMKSVGAKVVMTDESHPTGTDRLAEVATACSFDDEEIVVNWQGDEPFLPFEYISNVAQKLADNENAAMSTLATHIETWEDFLSPNIVKVVHDSADMALYFSRAPIPYPRGFEKREGKLLLSMQPLRHIGIYAYRAYFLKAYPELKPSPLESLELLEQLRALSSGYKIIIDRMSTIPPLGIDTEEELESARRWYNNNIKESQ